LNSIFKNFQGDGLKAELLRGVSGSAGIRVLDMLLTLATGVLLARILGPEGYGVYAFSLSIITLLSLPVKAGLPALLVRETAKNQLNEDWGLTRGLLKLANRFVFTYSISIAIIAATFLSWHWVDAENTKVTTLFWSLWLLPLIAFGAVRNGTLRGLRWVSSSQFPDQILKPLVMLLLLAITLSLGSNITSTTAIQFNITGTILAFLMGAILLRKALPSNVRYAPPQYKLTTWVTSLLPLSLFGGLKLLDAEVSILLLGLLGTTEEVGLFRVAATGATIVAFALTAVNMAIAPQVARLYNAGETEKLQRVISLSTRAIAAVSFPIALILIFWGEDVIAILFGKHYVHAATALTILCLAQLVNTSTGAGALVLNMTGNDRSTVTWALVALASNFSMAVIMIPVFGLVGAAISYLTSVTIWNLAMMVMAKKKTGIDTFLGAHFFKNQRL
jgi:O-antigen/teichoic acid export membrane protein